AYLAAVLIYLSDDSSDEWVISRLPVDKSEYGVDSFLSGFFYHFCSILVCKAPERPGSKLEQGLDELDGDMVVEESKTSQLREFRSNCQLSASWRSVDENEFHSGSYFTLDMLLDARR